MIDGEDKNVTLTVMGFYKLSCLLTGEALQFVVFYDNNDVKCRLKQRSK